MAQTHAIDGACPVCGAAMYVSRLSCAACGSTLEGALHIVGATAVGPSASADAARFGRLARLDESQLQFVEAFLRCRGIIKNVEDMLGISYPTVKARLASVLETMGVGAEDDVQDADKRQARRDILTELAAGRISTEEAHRLLARDV